MSFGHLSVSVSCNVRTIVQILTLNDRFTVPSVLSSASNGPGSGRSLPVQDEVSVAGEIAEPTDGYLLVIKVHEGTYNLNSNSLHHA